MTNEKFNKLALPQQRVAIARDVIAQIDAHKYFGSSQYLIIRDKKLRRKVEDADTSQLCSVLGEIETCEVCARGALFLSTIRLKNHFQINELRIDDGNVSIRYDTLEHSLERAFTKYQQAMIEYAYEGWDVAHVFADAFHEGVTGGNPLLEDIFDQLKHSLESFSMRYKNDDNRLKAIMRNIIRNKGEFKPVKYVLDVK